MDWSVIASLLLGWLGQQAKAFKNIPTPAAQAGMFLIAIGIYAFQYHPTFTDDQWLKNGIAWAMAVLGFSSVTAATGIAPKTDSK